MLYSLKPKIIRKRVQNGFFKKPPSKALDFAGGILREEEVGQKDEHILVSENGSIFNQSLKADEVLGIDVCFFGKLKLQYRSIHVGKITEYNNNVA